MDDRSHLLKKLSIDRTAGEQSSSIPGRATWLSVTALVVLISGSAFLYLQEDPEVRIAGEDSISSGAEDLNSVIPAAQAQAPAAQPSPQAAPADDQVLNGSGYVTARRMATVSAEITGRITEVFIEEGMVVEAGQIIAQLDDVLAVTDLKLARARVVAASADVATAEANLKESRRVLERSRELSTSNFVSEAEVTRNEARVEAQTAGLDRARADLVIAGLEVERRQEMVNKYQVRAPFTGVIVNKAAQPGEIVSPVSAGGGFTRTGIGTLVDMDSLEIEVDVNESYIGRVSPGQRVSAKLDAYPDWTLPASVIAIIPTADRAKATVRVRIAIELRDPRILPDMGVKVAFHRTGN